MPLHVHNMPLLEQLRRNTCTVSSWKVTDVEGQGFTRRPCDFKSAFMKTSKAKFLLNEQKLKKLRFKQKIVKKFNFGRLC